MADKAAGTSGTAARVAAVPSPAVSQAGKPPAPAAVKGPVPAPRPDPPLPPPPVPFRPEPPPPLPETMTVVMANATHGAPSPGFPVTVDAETGRALIRAGEAVPFP